MSHTGRAPSDLPDEAREVAHRDGERAAGISLKQLIADARARYLTLTPEQKAQHDYAQRRSFVRGMCPSTMNFDIWCEIVDRILPPFATHTAMTAPPPARSGEPS